MRPAKPELISHLHDFAVAELDFDEFRAADRFSTFVLECGDDLSCPSVDHVGCVAPGVTAIEAERYPAVTTLSQFNVTTFLRRHLCRVENKELFAFLIAEPEFLFVRR